MIKMERKVSCAGEETPGLRPGFLAWALPVAKKGSWRGVGDLIKIKERFPALAKRPWALIIAKKVLLGMPW